MAQNYVDMKNTLKMLGVLLISMLVVTSCEKNEDENQPDGKTGDFVLKGNIVTDKMINKDNTIVAIAEDFNDTEHADDEVEGFPLGKDVVENKQFAIKMSSKQLEEWCEYATIEEIKKENKNLITKIECKASKIKAAALWTLVLQNSGTNIINTENLMLCTDKAEVLHAGDETIWNIPYSIGYMYCNEDFVLHKDFEKAEDLEAGEVPSKFVLNLKKGWNMLKIEHIFDETGEYTTITSIDKIPEGYEWRLMSDLFPDMFNIPSGKAPLKNAVAKDFNIF